MAWQAAVAATAGTLREAAPLCELRDTGEGKCQAFVSRVRDGIAALPVGSALAIPAGWRLRSGGHGMVLVVERDDVPATSSSGASIDDAASAPAHTTSSAAADPASRCCCDTQHSTAHDGHFNVVVINAGAGVEHHPGRVARDLIKTQRRTALHLRRVCGRRLNSTHFLSVLHRLQANSRSHHDAGVYYDWLLPYLTGGTLHESTEAADEGPRGGWHSVQRSGTCYFKCWVHTVKHLLQHHGLCHDCVKRVQVALRFITMVQVHRDLLAMAQPDALMRAAARGPIHAECALLNNNDMTLINIGVRRLSRALDKLVAATGGRGGAPVPSSLIRQCARLAHVRRCDAPRTAAPPPSQGVGAYNKLTDTQCCTCCCRAADAGGAGSHQEVSSRATHLLPAASAASRIHSVCSVPTHTRVPGRGSGSHRRVTPGR